MSFIFTPCSIDGLIEIKPKTYEDNRGYFFESWSQRDFNEAGITSQFILDNQSYSEKAVLRGLHYQIRHQQEKIVRVIFGEVYDVAVDLRPKSKTLYNWFGIILNSKIQNQLYIPKGFAHGFLVLSDIAILSYKCTDYYHPEDESGIFWNDPQLCIKWPKLNTNYILSLKDNNLPSISEMELKK